MNTFYEVALYKKEKIVAEIYEVLKASKL